MAEPRLGVALRISVHRDRSRVATSTEYGVLWVASRKQRIAAYFASRGVVQGPHLDVPSGPRLLCLTDWNSTARPAREPITRGTIECERPTRDSSNSWLACAPVH